MSGQKPENVPIMTKQDFIQGQAMMRNFLKGVDIKVKGSEVYTTYKWKFPDKRVAVAFAKGIAESFGGGQEQNG